MITEKLFQQDAYLKECVSPIAEIRENTILLEQTVFYAKSGGQEGDRGYFELDSGEKIPVLDTTFDENKAILHHLETVPATLKKGVSLKAIIDWELRYKRMQMHSAMHLMCSLIQADVTGGSVGAEKSRLDFDLKDEIPDKEELTEKINQLIQRGAEITTEWWDKEKLEMHPDLVRTAKVYPPSENGKYRMVKIGDIDLQPCGGTHVKNIQEIGELKIYKIKKKGKENRRISLCFADNLPTD